MIYLSREGDVFVLRMQAGENRFNGPFLDALHGALDEVEASEGGAALVTTGAGKFYSNGLDLAWFGGEGSGQVLETLQKVDRLFTRLLVFPVATVAAINGHAFAAGGMLAVAHDFRVMREDRGFFCLPEVDLGMGQPLTAGMYALLGAKLSPATFHEALITGKRYGGAEAAAAGVVNEALPEDLVLERAVQIAQELAKKDRATVAALKRGLYASALQALESPPQA
jgi:enoyl-CoA hydratase/carnithine racemase